MSDTPSEKSRLVAGLHATQQTWRKARYFGFIDRNIIRGPRPTGHSDKAPVLNQNLAEKERYDRPRMFYPCTVFLHRTQPFSGKEPVGKLSLSSQEECLSLQESILTDQLKAARG